jgi:hypothetical protein
MKDRKTKKFILLHAADFDVALQFRKAEKKHDSRKQADRAENDAGGVGEGGIG